MLCLQNKFIFCFYKPTANVSIREAWSYGNNPFPPKVKTNWRPEGIFGRQFYFTASSTMPISSLFNPNNPYTIASMDASNSEVSV